MGPQIIHQVAPAIPLGVAPRVTTDIQIDVTVAIDESGRVTGARVTSKSGAAAGLLTLEALKAAQLFRFRPAQENNHAIRSEMLLTFRFSAKTR
jgi:TonB family protein